MASILYKQWRRNGVEYMKLIEKYADELDSFEGSGEEFAALNCSRIEKEAKDILYQGLSKEQIYYLEYFKHMQEEDKKCTLGGMAWDDICWHIYGATEKDKCFTREELAETFPELLGHLVKKEG